MRLVAALIFATFCCPVAVAHDFRIVDVLALLTSDRQFQLDLRIDVDALALGAPPNADSAELQRQLAAMGPDELAAALGQAERVIRTRTRLKFDELEPELRIAFPQQGAAGRGYAGEPTFLGTVVRISGSVPSGAQTLRLRLSRAFGPVQLTIFEQSSMRSVRQVLEPGAESAPFRLGGAASTQPAVRDSSGFWSLVAGYFKLGFEHILPKGLDHILFVIALCLTFVSPARLVAEVTAFTLAHSLTLALAITDVVAAPARLIETLIAVSIAWVAIENCVRRENSKSRILVVLAFGLLHGLGFAGVLRELGMGAGHFGATLAAFNLGVEAGQVVVVLGSLLLIAGFRQRSWYRARIAIPISLVFGLVGSVWAIERATGFQMLPAFV